ncbi:MAG: carbohydrate binding family 9 domain-containing protein [Gemmatimonadetes bacterium]|nr:carbohydrate binding family 9 domain-containing protein [Gemmatimonadota bacterium]
MVRMTTRVLPALLIAALPVGGAGQEALELPRIAGPITIDGRVDEPAWDALDPLPATMHQPTFEGEPSERTEFRVAYDEDAIYFSCRAYDSDVAGLRAISLQRDDGSLSNDWCVLNLDTYDDDETALLFGTTPAGIRTDLVFFGDGAGMNFSWNTFWDAAVTRDEHGWYAEIRVPWTSLRFQEDAADGRVVMGLAVWRNIGRKNEMVSFPAISPRWAFAVVKASQFRDVALEGLRSRRPLYVTPYVLGGIGRSHALDAAGAGYARVEDRIGDVGIDLKLGLASNLTLDVTVNTDFAQVEADAQQVNLTRFSLFFPEKRLFFQERASLFDFSLGGDARLFHSRRIGLVDGEQVPIYAGARLNGRIGGWDVGLLDMQTRETAFAPGENLGVLRLRRRVLNQNSYVGGLVTTRFAEGGVDHNVVYGLDALLRVMGQEYLTLMWAQSFSEADDADPATAPDPLDRGLSRLYWERRGQDGFTYAIDFSRAGSAFDPGLGFLRRRDFSRTGGRIAYGWRPGEESPLLRHGFAIEGATYARRFLGATETAEITPEWVVELKSGHAFTATANATYEDLPTGFALSDDAAVPAGQHRFGTFGLSYRPPDAKLLRVGGSVMVGGFYDGRIRSFSASPAWNPSRHLELTATYRWDDIRFPDRDERFTAHIARLRSDVMVTTRLTAAAFIQYNSAADRFTTNARLRYNPGEGNDLYVVWNEGLNTDRHGADPTLPLRDRQTLMLKYARTLTLGL